MEPGERIRNLVYLSNVYVDKFQPIIRYFRSGSEMKKMAGVYLKEGNLEKAYILFMKFVTLFVEKLIDHPEYREISKDQRAWSKKSIAACLDEAEAIKTILIHRYTKEYQLALEEERKIEEEARYLEFKKELYWKRQKELEDKRILEASIASYNEERDRAARVDQSQAEAISSSLDQKKNLSAEDSSYFAPLSNSLSIGETKPLVDRSLKPKTTNFLEGGFCRSSDKLRTLYIPTILIGKFNSLSESNTNSNVETCAILAGRLARNEFRITHFIVPKQRGTSDSCVMLNEEELVTYQDKHDILTLGWIHTHPTQSAFLSSVDLHTHFSYQIMMAEAVAIVCAPSKRETKFFSLSDPDGMNIIRNCRLDGFHPHVEEPSCFEECSHVMLDTESDVTLVDLRDI